MQSLIAKAFEQAESLLVSRFIEVAAKVQIERFLVGDRMARFANVMV
ncbi:hypothetical protein [Alkaliflexus imshenetskii]|nr:hypothetical protein [Alkaliflexus imshenetskii]